MEENTPKEKGPGNEPGVDVSRELIDLFKDEYQDNTGSETETGGLAAIIDRAINDASLQIHRTIDEALKDQELKGLAKNDRELELQSQLAVIIGKKRFPAAAIENSPELIYGLMIGGSIIQNLLAYSQKQKKLDKQSSSKTETKESAKNE